MARRTKEEAQETRDRLLDTAEHVFNEKGVSRTSLSEIAEAAGLTRGAIYWHFKNKLDLFNAMMERVTLPMEEVICGMGECGPDDPIAYIRNRSAAVLRNIESNPQIQRVFEIVTHKCEYVDEMAPLRDRNLEGRIDCVSHVEEGLRNALKNGQLPKSVDPRLAAIGFHALMDGLIINWLLDPAYFSLGDDGEKVMDAYFRGLAIEPVANGTCPMEKSRKVMGKPMARTKAMVKTRAKTAAKVAKKA
ncbi:MAG: TetR family transcriptional regulator [Betaproteobacteria bacterium]